MIDRYTKFILTVIAGALLYLAAIFTPLPGLGAQTPSLRPGEPSGPTEVVIVGWLPGRREPIPVSIQQSGPLRVTGQVTTERSLDRADRVVLVGWEENAGRDRIGAIQQLNDTGYDPQQPGGFPVRLPLPK